ncbi:hypothetical protein [Microcella alkalica]|uniref:Uncharacterized protein n=1 Tax=Microcella alkalica TaxID=355930 RepID=A0A839EGD2_9MICO|nr:hypothetical protein [Microcella alkalica]MBA8848638.1 hypothetical protein [Microcella alkalica]
MRWFALDEVAQLERVELVADGLRYAGLALPTDAGLPPAWS